LPAEPRVLLVDDVAMLRAVFHEALENDGFTVVGEAADGDEAVREAARLQPDLVLLDISMPVRDGLDALPDIVQRAPRAKVVVLTGYEAATVGRRALALGAARFLEKGVPLAEILATLRELSPAEA
jgi:DNA-binding NarL/FixJ family response regulator